MATITNPKTNETITYNRIGGTPDNPIYFNDPTPSSSTPVNKTVNVVSYQDNPDGTTTEFLSDGSKSIVRYNINPDGSLQPYEVNTGASGLPANLTGNSLAPAQKLQVPSTNTVNSGSNAIIASTAQSNLDYNQAIADANKLKEAAGNKSDQAYKDILSQVKDLTQQKSDTQANQVNLENQAGLPEQQKALADINTQIADQQVQLRAEQERIRRTPMSKEQAQQESNVLNDTYGRRLADLAIRQSAAQGNIQAIKDNADRQTKLLLAPIDNKINYYKEFETTYADQLSKKEQQQLSLIQTNLQDQRKNLEALQTAKANMIMEVSKNGGGTDTATIQKIQEAKSISEVASAGSNYVGQLDFLKAQADIRQSNASTALSSAQLAKLNAETQAQIIKNKQNSSPAVQALRLAQNQTNIQAVDSLAKDPAIAGAVGTNFLSRGFFGGGTPYEVTGEQQNFIAGIEQMRSQLTLDNLINAKAQGATFGALSEGELKILNESATKIGRWAIKDSTGNVVGYNTSESSFKKELDKINNFSKLDYVLKGGNPDDIGVQLTNDGHLWSQNSDGTVTQLK